MANSNNLTATNPLAKVGTALRNMFKTNTPLLPPTPTTPTTTTTGIPKSNFTTTPTTTTGIPKNNFTHTWKPLKLSDFAKNGGGR